MPLASAIAAVTGVVLMLWRRTVAFFRSLAARLHGRRGGGAGGSGDAGDVGAVTGTAKASGATSARDAAGHTLR